MHILILPSWYMGTFNMLNGSFIREQAQSLAKHGCKVGVIYNNLVYTNDILSRKKLHRFKTLHFNDVGIPTLLNETYQIPALPIFTPLNRYIRHLNRVRNKMMWHRLFKKYVKHHGMPDILHVHSFYPDDVPKDLCQKHNLKYVITEHWSGFGNDVDFRKREFTIRRAYSKPSAVLTVSRSLQARLIERLGVSSTIIPNAIDYDQFRISTEKFEKFTFIAVGHLKPIKQFDLLIKAFKGVDDSQLLIVGDGDMRKELEELALSLNLPVIFKGRLDRLDVQKLIGSSHVLVSSSKLETFGVTIIEALACGVPVVATKSGGPEEIITSEEYGLLCNQDVDSLRAALRKVKLNYDNYNAEIIRQKSSEIYSEKSATPRITDLYNKILSE